MRSNAIQKVFQTIHGYYSNLFTGLHCYNNSLVKSDLMNHLKYDERILNRSGFYHTTYETYETYKTYETYEPPIKMKNVGRSGNKLRRQHIKYLV